MNKRYWLYGAAFLLILGLLWMFIHNSTASSRYSWNETYNRSNKQPYNTSFLYKYLENTQANGKGITILNKRIREALPFKKASESATYVFVGQTFYLSSNDADSLVRFVERGGEAFISTKSMPYELMDYLYFKDCYDTEWRDFYALEDTMVSLNFNHPQLKSTTPYTCKFVFKGKTEPYQWRALDSLYMCDDIVNPSMDNDIPTIVDESDEEYSDEEREEAEEENKRLRNTIPRSGLIPLGYMTVKQENHVNFAKIKYGTGAFYIHTTPLALTDYALSTSEGQIYVEKIMGHLKPSTIYWDVASSEQDFTRDEPERREESKRKQSSPLKAILLEDELRWAWYILLGIGLLYLLFRAKRRQRVIPVLAENTNTSLAFIDTLGRLHFRQQNHHDLALQQMKIFQNHLRERYSLNTKEAPITLIPKIAKRSELSEDRINAIYDTYRDIETDLQTSANKLITLHSALHYFYTNAK